MNILELDLELRTTSLELETQNSELHAQNLECRNLRSNIQAQNAVIQKIRYSADYSRDF
ncbi:hypothetical protein [Nostoc sp.]|uniref:hypothetical protein n=1 Tax=Nostoc sp. TaxID=1180 RepID=UPI002FF47350